MANQTQPFFKSIFWMYFGLAIATVFFWSPIFYSPPEKGLQSNFQKEYQFCKDYLGSFQSGDKNKVVSLTDEGLIAGLIKVFPGWMDGFKKSGEIRAMYLIEVTEDKNSNHIGLKYYIDYKNTSGLMDMVIVPIGGSYKVVGIHPNPLALSYENNMLFEFRGRSWVQYLFLFLAYGLFLTCAAAFVFCGQCDNLGGRQKFSWMIAILLGTISLSMYWIPSSWNHVPLMLVNPTTNTFNIQFITLFPSGILKVPIYYPWKVWISFPIGLILFFWKKPYKIKDRI